jgi:hypothetical protein
MSESLSNIDPSSAADVMDSTTGSAAKMPSSVLFVALAVILFIGLFTLEISDSLVRHHGQIARSIVFLPVALLLLWGILKRHRWAWTTTRVLSALASVFYGGVGIAVWIFFSHLQTGLKVWLSTVSGGLLALTLTAFLSLGHTKAGAYFRV